MATARGIASRLHRSTAKVLDRFTDSRTCPLCDWTGYQFLPRKSGGLLRFDAQCPSCGSMERHRLAHMTLQGVLPGRVGKLLHFAPEPLVRKWLESICNEYHSADLYDPEVMHKIDIQQIPFEDNSFDLVWCSHVLEHIPDDRKAMSEICRIIKPGGMAVIQVPLWGSTTIEGDLPVEERVRVYYQADHLRRYGADIVARLTAAGFTVSVKNVQDLDLQTVLRHSLNDMASNDIFICRKSATAANDEERGRVA
jgi:SAM-dependent methyltransferase